MENIEKNNPRKDNDRREEKEKKIDEQIEQSFPASDPPSYSSPGNDLEEDTVDEEDVKDGDQDNDHDVNKDDHP